MDADLLAQKSIEPADLTTGFVEGYELRIGERATLVRVSDSRVYGVVMELASSELTELYSEASVADYEPEPVAVELMDGSQVEATCYNLPGDKLTGTNEAYADALLNLATSLGFPDDYLHHIRRARAQR